MKTKRISPVQINKTYNLEIQDITSSGEGIAKYKDFTIFIDKTVPGDKVETKIIKIKPNYALGEVIKVIESSQNCRNNSYCSNTNICGGCPYSNLNYGSQLKIKEKSIKDAIERIGGFKNIKILPIISSNEFNYRNKAQFKVDKTGVGFYQKGSHNLIHINNCSIQQDAINSIIPILNKLIKSFKISIYNEKTHKGLLRGILVRSNDKDELIIVFIINSKKFPHKSEILEELQKNKNIVGVYLNINENKGNRILGNQTITLFKNKELIENLDNKKFKISPSSFFQVNTKQAKVLYDIVKEYADLKSGDHLLDLYCGTGSIGIYLATPNINLTGIEVNADAIKDANYNKDLNNLSNATFYTGKAEVIVPTLKEKPTCIILDPPRKGCEKSLLDYLLTLNVKRIVYVSCNPATLARDLKILSQKYIIKKIQPVDLFPQTGHVESVTLLLLK